MSRGRLRCCGSPLYLKSKYSSGYNLVLTKLKYINNNDSKLTHEIDNRAIDLVKNTISGVKLNENLNSEISFILPVGETSKFSELFNKIDEQKEYLNVKNIGISISTLEDVFLKYDLNTYSNCQSKNLSNSIALKNKRI
jgi:hypothetical protein